MSIVRTALASAGLAAIILATPIAPLTGAASGRNVLLFVPDGLRALKVDADTAPTMAALRDRGVNFRNPHSLMPTVTTANASAMATGHYLGDTGDFSNSIFVLSPVAAADGSVVPFIEHDGVLGELDKLFAGNYLDEVTVARAAREAGLSTALVGKLGPTLIHDHTNRTGSPTIVIDDATGAATGIPLSSEMQGALAAAGLPLVPPARTDNATAGTYLVPGTKSDNHIQQDYFVDVVTRVVLPLFKARGKPFFLLFWSRDPDGSQHNQGDSLLQLTPGINGPTALAGIRNADTDLARLQRALADLGLADNTDIVVSADHGFSTISKQSQTSPSAKLAFTGVPSGFLPPGFLALDLSRALGLPLFDPDNKNARVIPPAPPRRANGLIGADPLHPSVVVAGNGGSDLIYLPQRDRALARRVVDALLAQDYVSGIFVDSALGRMPGTLPLSAINLEGAAVTPRPSIVVGFASMSTGGCAQPELCSASIADTALQQGQGNHGSFSRADSMNFMAAIGPDFKSAFSNPAPASNADVGQTIAHLLGLKLPSRGKLAGRVLTEALTNGKAVTFTPQTMQSDAASNGLRTMLNYQKVGSTLYFDAAGFAGKTVGLR